MLKVAVCDDDSACRAEIGKAVGDILFRGMIMKFFTIEVVKKFKKQWNMVILQRSYCFWISTCIL